MSILNTKKYWYLFSSILLLGSLVSLIVFGLRLNIDFTGGSLLEIRFEQERPAKNLLEEKIIAAQVETTVNTQETEKNGYLLRMKNLTEQEHQTVITALKELGNFEELRFDSVGPIIGQELKTKALWAISLSILGIIIYISWAFRKVSKPVSSWKYGIIAVIALCHDILITLGIFALLGHFKGIEVGLPFVAALLTILGYSVNDTIVVFDRIRENLILSGKNETLPQIIDKSISQTMARSLNTSFTTLLALLALLLFGGNTIYYFVLTLMIGIMIGTYSSICVASPLLLEAEKLQRK